MEMENELGNGNGNDRQFAIFKAHANKISGYDTEVILGQICM